LPGEIRNVKPEIRVPIKHSIATKLLKIVFSLYLVIAIGVTLGHMIMEYRHQKDNIRKDLKGIQKAFERSLAIDLWQMNQESLFSTIEGMLALPFIVGVKVQNVKGLDVAIGGTIVQGEVVGNFGRNVDLLGLHPGEAGGGGRKLDDFDIFKHQFPLVYTSGKTITRLGNATIYSSTSVVFGRVKFGFLMLVANAVVKTTALWFIFLWVSTVLLRRPLGILTRATKEISLNNLESFSVDTKTSGQNEIKVLEEAMTSMATDLSRVIYRRKEVTASLRRSEEKYRALIENAPDLRYRTDLEGTISFISQSALKLTGYSVERLVGTKISAQYIDPGKREIFKEKLMAKGSVENYLAELKRRDGTRWWASTNASLLRDKGGIPTGIQGVSRDVTGRKQAEQSFQTLVKSTAEHTGQALFDTIVRNLCTLFNCEYAIIGEIIDSQTVQVISMEASGKLVENFSYQLKGTPCHRVTQKGYCQYKDHITEFFPEDHNLIKMNARGYVGIPLVGDGNHVLGILCVISSKKLNLPDHVEEIMNILQARATAEIERKRANEQNKQLENQLHKVQKIEAIGTLAGGIAHDFNNILFPISGYVEILMEDLPDHSVHQEYLNRISTGIKRAGDLVKQILMFGRQAKGETTALGIHSILKEAVKLSRATIPSTIKIESYIDNDCGHVMADPSQIHQIVMNLITNAYQAIEPAGGTLGIRLRQVDLTRNNLPSPGLSPGLYICLSVTDTGSGIDSRVIHQIFDPYFTTKKKGKGTGLGLSVVHGIVKSCGGDIHVQSEPGEKTVFDVYFPRVEYSQEIGEKKMDPVLPGGREHILIVDDEESIVVILKNMLARLGYRVTAETSSLKALDRFKSQPGKFDLVMSDVTMPEMAGDQLAKELKKIHKTISIILFTGYSEKIDMNCAEELGVDAILMKPVKKRDLALAIRRALA